MGTVGGGRSYGDGKERNGKKNGDGKGKEMGGKRSWKGRRMKKGE